MSTETVKYISIKDTPIIPNGYNEPDNIPTDTIGGTMTHTLGAGKSDDLTIPQTNGIVQRSAIIDCNDNTTDNLKVQYKNNLNILGEIIINNPCGGCGPANTEYSSGNEKELRFSYEARNTQVSKGWQCKISYPNNTTCENLEGFTVILENKGYFYFAVSTDNTDSSLEYGYKNINVTNANKYNIYVQTMYINIWDEEITGILIIKSRLGEEIGRINLIQEIKPETHYYIELFDEAQNEIWPHDRFLTWNITDLNNYIENNNINDINLIGYKTIYIRSWFDKITETNSEFVPVKPSCEIAIEGIDNVSDYWDIRDYNSNGDYIKEVTGEPGKYYMQVRPRPSNTTPISFVPRSTVRIGFKNNPNTSIFIPSIFCKTEETYIHKKDITIKLCSEYGYKCGLGINLPNGFEPNKENIINNKENIIIFPEDYSNEDVIFQTTDKNTDNFILFPLPIDKDFKNENDDKKYEFKGFTQQLILSKYSIEPNTNFTITESCTIYPNIEPQEIPLSIIVNNTGETTITLPIRIRTSDFLETPIDEEYLIEPGKKTINTSVSYGKNATIWLNSYSILPKTLTITKVNWDPINTNTPPTHNGEISGYTQDFQMPFDPVKVNVYVKGPKPEPKPEPKTYKISYTKDVNVGEVKFAILSNGNKTNISDNPITLTEGDTYYIYYNLNGTNYNTITISPEVAWDNPNTLQSYSKALYAADNITYKITFSKINRIETFKVSFIKIEGEGKVYFAKQGLNGQKMVQTGNTITVNNNEPYYIGYELTNTLYKKINILPEVQWDGDNIQKRYSKSLFATENTNYEVIFSENTLNVNGKTIKLQNSAWPLNPNGDIEPAAEYWYSWQSNHSTIPFATSEINYNGGTMYIKFNCYYNPNAKNNDGTNNTFGLALFPTKPPSQSETPTELTTWYQDDWVEIIIKDENNKDLQSYTRRDKDIPIEITESTFTKNNPTNNKITIIANSWTHNHRDE